MKILTWLLISVPFMLAGQITEEPAMTLTEDIIALDENNQEDGAAYENLIHLVQHRIDLNSASQEELKLLRILSDTQISNLIQHRNENGKLLSLCELQSIDGFDIETVKNLISVSTVRSPSEVIDKSLLKRITTEGENYLMMLGSMTFENKKGFRSVENPDQAFHGSPAKLLMRFRSSRPGDFSVGVTLEKDEGEKFRWNPKNNIYGTDYLSFHAQLLNKGRLKKMIVGDFQAQFGQGLMWGGSLGFGKGAESITSVRKANIGVVPYTSAYESGFFRGVGASYELMKNTALTLLYSSARRDASVHEGESINEASSIQTTGLHRNDAELAKRGSLKENVYGVVLQYKVNGLSAGTSFQHLRYDTYIKRKKTAYNQFAFEGNQNSNTGIFFDYNYHNVAMFGEVAKSLQHGSAVLAGALISLTKKTDLSIVYRNYSRDYHPFYANGFSENTIPQNEKGIYWGWKYKFNRKFSYSGYFDLFEFPWLKFRTYAPSYGTEWLMRFSWQPSRQTLFFIQARQEIKGRNNGDSDINNYKVIPVTRNNFWINFDYMINTGFKMKTRVQLSQFRAGSRVSNGFLIFHDASVQFRRLKCSGRFAIFDTEDYDNRQYAYENDVWLTYSLPAYYGIGTRKYILLQYKFSKALTLWIKYSHTQYLHNESIGSGADLIDGNQRNDIKFEARFSF